MKRVHKSASIDLIKDKGTPALNTIKDDAELNELITKQKKKMTTGIFVFIGGMLFIIVGGVLLGGLGILAGILIFFWGVRIISKAKREIRNYLSANALIPALEDVFDNVEYSPRAHIPSQTIRSTDMGFKFVIDEISGNDYIKAEYKGVRIEMSDIQLITEGEYYDSDGHRQTTRKTMFKGLWLICDFRKQFSADLLLRERDGVRDKITKSSVQTESESFNKQFVICSENAHDVFYILTPHMMEYIQEMDKKANGRTYMRFLKEGKLVLALDTGRDSFEIKDMKKATIESMRKQFVEEIKYITDLIDELRLVDTLHGENVKFPN